MGRIEWPSAIVGVTLILVIGAITIAAIQTYDTVDDALKFWSALSGLVGIVTGAFVTYFFTRGTVQQAQQQVEAQQRTAQQVQDQVQGLQEETLTTNKALGVVAGELEPGKWENLKKDPTVARALEPSDF